jgi:hypothetical protein
MEFYRKHIFLFNQNCNKLFQMTIMPNIKSNEGLEILFRNESLIIKKFIFNLEEEILILN